MLKTSRLAILFVTVLVDMIGFGIVLPLLPYYAESFGASPSEVTLLIASFSAMQFVSVPIWGRFSDRLGRRPFIVAGLFASAVSYLIFGLAQSLAMLFFSRIAAGAAGGTISVAQAYVADTTEASDRAHGMGMLGAAAGLGVLIGPAIGGYFSAWGYGVPGYIAAGLCLANGVAAVFFLPESRRGRSRDRVDGEVAAGSADPRGERSGQAATVRAWVRSLTTFPFALLLIVYFLSIMSFTAMTAVLALYVERAHAMDAMDVGIIFATAGGTTVVVRGLIVGWLARRFGERRIVQAGTLVLATALLTIPLIRDSALIFATVPLWALATGLTFPSLASLVSQETDSESQGAMLGGQQVVGGVGRVLGPVGAGVLFETVGITSPFFAGACLVAIAALLATRIPAPPERRVPAALDDDSALASEDVPA
ncbi:MAG: MFS transporter [Gemmatimonadetes bacterium]|nr:MFS transporter [Gemmatimonadota bacterium]